VRSRQSSWTRGDAHTDKLAGPLQGRPKTSAVSCRIASSLHRLNVLAPRTQVVHKRGYARVLSLCANTSYFGWSQNRKILKVPYTHSQAKCLLGVSYSTDDPPLFCLDFTETLATFVLITSLEHSTGRKAFTFTNGFFFVVLLVVRETRLDPKMCYIR